MRSAFLSNLGLSLSTRYDLSGRADDLDDAVEAFRQAVTLTGDGHIENADPRLAIESLETGRSVLWRQSLNLHQDAVELTRKDPAKAERLLELAGLLGRHDHNAELVK
jgi:hypothetical protein